MNISKDFIEFANNIFENKWIFAKTMPHNPHWYTLRKNWNDDKFIAAVLFIRENGYREKYGKSYYTVLDMNGMKYWTMGAPIWYKNGKPCTILINRAWISKDKKNEYDDIAFKYDDMFKNDNHLKENIEVIDRIKKYDFKSVLDIGCGTGLFLEYVKIRPENYIGIDPSKKMLEKLTEKNSDYLGSVLETTFDCYIGKDYVMQKSDIAISLFGAINYVHPDKIKDICMFTDKQFLMFYKNDYIPELYKKTGMFMDHFDTSEYDLTGYSITEFNNFLIAEK